MSLDIRQADQMRLILMAQASKSVWDSGHYLGCSRASLDYSDEWGFITLVNPTSRRLPQDWLELNRWMLLGQKNGGSRQWKACRLWLRTVAPLVTTVVSYSDPSVGHTGALYKACGFLWAPTWHRLVPPPTGNGIRSGRIHSAKDRWVYPLLPDQRRVELLSLEPAYERRFPGAGYREPRWKRGKPLLRT